MEPRRPLTRFQRRTPLGRGGGGTVERAFDRELELEVAVKRLHAVSPGHESALRREHRLHRDLHHPCLVMPLELGRDADGLFLVSPFVDGEDFVTHCRGSECRIASAVPQLLSVLRYLHERGLAHGDLSPSNVLVERSGRVRVIDLGLAGGDGRHVAGRGTPGYAAPERWRGPSPADDLFAFGALLAEVTSGTPRSRDLTALLDALSGPPARRPVAATLERTLLPLLSAVALPPAAVSKPPLVGRDELIERVRGAIEAGRTVVLSGPSAIGKTALLNALVQALRGERAVLRVDARPGSRLPFDALDQLFEQAVADLGSPTEAERAAAERVGRYSPSVASWIGQSPHALRTRAELHARLFASVPEPSLADDAAVLLERLAPLVVVDDLQWVDRDSVTCLAELAVAGRLVALVAARPAVDFPGERVAVPPLDESSLAALLSSRGLDAAAATKVLEEARGVPGVALLAARFAAGDRPLQDAVADRVRRELDDRARKSLATLLAAGGPAPLPVDIADTLLRQGLVARAGARFDITHDLLRDPIEQALGEDWMRAARAERAMEPSVPAAARVEAFLAVGHLRRAAEVARVAAREAFDVGAYHTAAALWEVVARVDPTARRARAEALVAANRHGEAAEIWAALETESGQAQRRSYALARARALLASRRIEEGREALRHALGAPARPWQTALRFLRGPRPEPPALDPESAELALRNAALAGYYDSLEGVRLALDARSAFPAGSDDDLGVWADSLLAFFARFGGLPRLARRYRHAASSRSVRQARPLVAAFPSFLRGYEALREGDASRAVRIFDAALETVEGTADASSFEVLLVLSLRTSAVLKSQRVAEASAAIARFEAAVRRQPEPALEIHLETARALCLTWQGRYEDALAGLDRARRAWAPCPKTVPHILIEAYASWPRALLGRACAAHDALQEVLRGQRLLLASAYGPILLAFAAFTELAASRRGHPGASRTRAVRRAAMSMRRASFASGLARRVVAYATGFGWENAASAARRDTQPLDEALALFALGERSGDGRLRARARKQLAATGASDRLLEEASVFR